LLLSYCGVVVFDLDRTQNRHCADYYDVATILGQLGLLKTLERIGRHPR
jgi:hypothetical protein